MGSEAPLSPDGRWEWDGHAWMPRDPTNDGRPTTPGFDGARFAARVSFWGVGDLQTTGGVLPLIVSDRPGFIVGAVGGLMANVAMNRRRARKAAEVGWHPGGDGEVILGASSMTMTIGAESKVVPYQSMRITARDRARTVVDCAGLDPILLEVHDQEGWDEALDAIQGQLFVMPTPEVVEPQLPVVGWCQQDRRAMWGMPEGWQLSQPQLLGGLTAEMKFAVTAGINLYRSPQAWFIVLGDLGPAQSITPERLVMEGQVITDGRVRGVQAVTGLGAWQSAGPSAVSLGGEPGVLVRFGYDKANQVRTEIGELYTVHNGNLMVLIYAAATGNGLADIYERGTPDFRTAIGSWHWNG